MTGFIGAVLLAYFLFHMDIMRDAGTGWWVAVFVALALDVLGSAVKKREATKW